jgi:GNAT superfamily N-acetyltransferase
VVGLAAGIARLCEDSLMLSHTVAELSLEPMTRHHLEAVIRIEREIYPFPWSSGNFADSIDAGYDAIVVPARDDASGGATDLLGYAVMMHVLDETHLLNLSIASKLQRRGMGRRLLQRLMLVACSWRFGHRTSRRLRSIRIRALFRSACGATTIPPPIKVVKMPS